MASTPITSRVSTLFTVESYRAYQNLFDVTIGTVPSLAGKAPDRLNTLVNLASKVSFEDNFGLVTEFNPSLQMFSIKDVNRIKGVNITFKETSQYQVIDVLKDWLNAIYDFDGHFFNKVDPTGVITINLNDGSTTFPGVITIHQAIIKSLSYPTFSWSSADAVEIEASFSCGNVVFSPLPKIGAYEYPTQVNDTKIGSIQLAMGPGAVEPAAVPLDPKIATIQATMSPINSPPTYQDYASRAGNEHFVNNYSNTPTFGAGTSYSSLPGQENLLQNQGIGGLDSGTPIEGSMNGIPLDNHRATYATGGEELPSAPNLAGIYSSGTQVPSSQGHDQGYNPSAPSGPSGAGNYLGTPPAYSYNGESNTNTLLSKAGTSQTPFLSNPASVDRIGTRVDSTLSSADREQAKAQAEAEANTLRLNARWEGLTP